MSIDRDNFCNSIKVRYPEISTKADADFAQRWDDFSDPETDSYSWFESLANALNIEMCSNVPPTKYNDLFKTISVQFESGDSDTRNAIDVGFVENLFWKVPIEKSARYWAVLPENLKRLYVNFHHRTPL